MTGAQANRLRSGHNRKIKMTANVLPQPIERKVRVKGIALPTEHGSWGFLFEPLLASIAVAPSFAAMWIAVTVIGAFLTRQPLKVFLADLQAKRNLPQTAVARKFVLIFGAITLIGFLGSLYFTKFESFIPFLAVIPLGIYQIYCDASRKSRNLLPELTSTIAISSAAAVIALAGGWHIINALALWAIFILRSIPSILYVRNRLRLEKGKTFSRFMPVALHLLAQIIISAMFIYRVCSLLTVIMFIVLTVRSIWGLSPFRKRVKAIKIGIWEVIYGTLTALSVIIGYYLQF